MRWFVGGLAAVVVVSGCTRSDRIHPGSTAAAAHPAASSVGNPELARLREATRPMRTVDGPASNLQAVVTTLGAVDGTSDPTTVFYVRAEGKIVGQDVSVPMGRPFSTGRYLVWVLQRSDLSMLERQIGNNSSAPDSYGSSFPL